VTAAERNGQHLSSKQQSMRKQPKITTFQARIISPAKPASYTKTGKLKKFHMSCEIKEKKLELVFFVSLMENICVKGIFF
jgi:hypothetical protein